MNKVGTGIYNELTDFTRLKGALAENEKLKDEIDLFYPVSQAFL